MKSFRSGNWSRRSFLTAAGTSSVSAAIVPRYVLGGKGFIPPSEKVNIAIIGTGGQGIVNMRQLLKYDDAQIIALADPNSESDYSGFYYGGTAGRQPALRLMAEHYRKTEATGSPARCFGYIDYRQMLDKEKSIDAIVVATPDHVHAVASLQSMELGKHVYCEKPLTHSIWEAREVARLAKESGVATQMGNQGHSGEGIRQTCEWLWAGAIGEVREVHAWTGASGWAQGGRPVETPAVPDSFDWDIWLGPAPYRPYHPAYAPYNWRGWWEFGTAAIGDMACHNFDPAFWALKLEHPDWVEPVDTAVSPETAPEETTVRYYFPERGELPPVIFTWYDGTRRPPRPIELEAGEKLDGNGILFVGSKGKILCGGWGGVPKLLPDSLDASFSRPAPTIPRSNGHHRDWLDACKGGSQPSSNFEYAAALTEVVLLGNVALRTGSRIHWNWREMKVSNPASAQAYVELPWRPSWRS